MTDERATIRPVTLGRLVDVTDRCLATTEPVDAETLSETLEITQRRARETMLEARRIGLLAVDSSTSEEGETFTATSTGDAFIASVRHSDWTTVSDLLADGSPQYATFLDVLATHNPGPSSGSGMTAGEVLDEIEIIADETPYTYNQTSIDVLTGWGERLGAVGRNAFTETYYRITATEELDPDQFATELLDAYDDLEETAGVNLSQRYLSIPRLREQVCERLACTREAFDDALARLCADNIGKLELSGGPIDTAAKESPRGIRRIHLSEGDGLVTTTQLTDRVLDGLEQHGKRYYYLAVFDRDLTIDS